MQKVQFPFHKTRENKNLLKWDGQVLLRPAHSGWQRFQRCPRRICLRKEQWVDLCVTAPDLIPSCSNWHLRQLFTFLSLASF